LRIVSNNRTFDIINTVTSNVIFSILNDGSVGAGSTIYTNLITNYADSGSGSSGGTVVSSLPDTLFTTNPTGVSSGTIGTTDRYYIFTHTGGYNTNTAYNNVPIPAGITFDLFMIGGGGAGGGIGGSGGGSGACLVALNQTIAAGNYGFVVGGAGSGGITGSGNSGYDTYIGNNIYKARGGGGGAADAVNGIVGGSSGGAAGGVNNTAYTSPAPATDNYYQSQASGPVVGTNYGIYGNKGGNTVASTTVYTYGGGGGIGVAAANANTSTRTTTGGDGLYQVSLNNTSYNLRTYFTNNGTFGVQDGSTSNYFIGGGGGGGGWNGNGGSAPVNISGGLGGGGIGKFAGTIANGTDGAPNTGSGGGGGSTGWGGNSFGGNGGSGLLIFRYRNTSNVSASAGVSSQWTTVGTKIYYNLGNIGIGATDPIAPLHIYNATNARLLLDATTTGTATLEFRRGTGGDAQNDFRFINDSNNSNGSFKLQCENLTQVFGNAIADLAWFSSNETIIHKNTTMNGRVGVGTVYHATRTLDVVGDANVYGTVSVGNLSISGSNSVTITNTITSNTILAVGNTSPPILITPSTGYISTTTTEGSPSVKYQTETFTFNQGNVIAYYKFNGNYNDSNPSTTKYNLTATGAPDFISTATNFIDGSAVYFNVNNEFLATAGNFPNTFGTSYSFWFKRSNNNTHDMLFAIGTEFFLVAHTVNKFYFSNTLGGSETYGQANITWVDNTWYHCVFMFLTDGTWKLYINGAEITFTTLGGNYPFTAGNGKMPTGKLYIGGKNVGYWTNESLEGYIDEFYVFNKELTQTEITNLYNKTYSLPNNTWNINFPTSTPVIINNGASQNVVGNYTISVSNNSSVIPAGGQSATPYPSTAITTVAIKYPPTVSTSTINLVRGTVADANHDYRVGNYNGEFKIVSSVSSQDTDYIRITTAGAITNPTGTASWNTGSDRRIKENIERASYDKCYENINKLELNRFNYVSGFNTVNRDKTQLGFIAQEVNDIFPKAISSQEYYTNELCIPDLLSIDITQINYSLYGAVKKLIKINKDQETRFDTFDRRLKTIETALNIVTEPTTSNIIIDPIEPTTSNIIVESQEPTTSNIIVDPIEPATSNIIVDPIEPATSNIIVDPIEPATSNIIVESQEPATSNIIVDPIEPTTSNIIIDPIEPTTSNIIVESQEPTTSNLATE
jgi:hypothetical protein